jgi:hypothetical protein
VHVQKCSQVNNYKSLHSSYIHTPIKIKNIENAINGPNKCSTTKYPKKEELGGQYIKY